MADERAIEHAVEGRGERERGAAEDDVLEEPLVGEEPVGGAARRGGFVEEDGLVGGAPVRGVEELCVPDARQRTGREEDARAGDCVVLRGGQEGAFPPQADDAVGEAVRPRDCAAEVEDAVACVVGRVERAGRVPAECDGPCRAVHRRLEAEDAVVEAGVPLAVPRERPGVREAREGPAGEVGVAQDERRVGALAVRHVAVPAREHAARRGIRAGGEPQRDIEGGVVVDFERRFHGVAVRGVEVEINPRADTVRDGEIVARVALEHVSVDGADHDRALGMLGAPGADLVARPADEVAICGEGREVGRPRRRGRDDEGDGIDARPREHVRRRFREVRRVAGELHAPELGEIAEDLCGERVVRGEAEDDVRRVVHPAAASLVESGERAGLRTEANVVEAAGAVSAKAPGADGRDGGQVEEAVVAAVADAVAADVRDGEETVRRECTGLDGDVALARRSERPAVDACGLGDAERPANRLLRAGDEFFLKLSREVRFVHGDGGVVREALVDGGAVGVDLEAREPGFEVAGERAGRDDGGGGTLCRVAAEGLRGDLRDRVGLRFVRAEDGAAQVEGGGARRVGEVGVCGGARAGDPQGAGVGVHDIHGEGPGGAVRDAGLVRVRVVRRVRREVAPGLRLLRPRRDGEEKEADEGPRAVVKKFHVRSFREYAKMHLA